MRFEWDANKAESNAEKHGVTFEEASEIWHDPNLMVVHARNVGEKRMMAIGKVYAVMFSVVHTKRGDVIRIISARRSTPKERSLYERGLNQ